MFQHIRADLLRAAEAHRALFDKLPKLVFDSGLHAVLLYRLSHWLCVHHLFWLGVVVSYWNSVFTGAQISPHAVIGKGLLVHHPRGLVIGPVAIGAYCTFTRLNMVGQRRGGGDWPSIGDHFYAGRGAKVLGRIQIGNNVRVEPQAVVIDSLPDGVRATGIPAKIVSEDLRDEQLSKSRFASRREDQNVLTALRDADRF